MGKSCQSSLFCPDTFGHLATWFMVGYLVASITHIPLGFAILVILAAGLAWEYYEAYNDKKNFNEWMDYTDSLKDMFIDYFGGITGIGVGVELGFKWWIVLLVVIVGLFFGRFTSWGELKQNWKDLRLWKYFPLDGIKRIIGK